MCAHAHVRQKVTCLVVKNDEKFFIFAMPPVRCRRAHRNKESSAPSNVDTVTRLRRQSTEKGLPTYGCRNALVACLQQHAATNANMPSTLSQVEESRALLTDLQITAIQLIVS